MTAAEIVGQAEGLPPIGQVLIHLAHIGAQAHEVEPGTETRLHHHAERRVAHALFKARLHDPDLAHVGGQLAPARHVTDALVEHFVDERQLAIFDRQLTGA